MSEGLLEAHAHELRARIAALIAGLGVVDVEELKGQAHRLRGSALVLGLDSLAGTIAAFEAALASPPDLDTARRAADRAARELELALEHDLPASAVSPRDGGGDRSAGLSVLLVEDDALVAGVVARMLDVAGVSVETVTGLAEARSALAERGYDAAVVDLRLADGNGDALVPDLRERGIRAIVLTGDGRTVVPGAEQVLEKPVDSAVLVAAVTGRPLPV